MRVLDTNDVGNIIRAKRKELGYTQRELAQMSGSGTRFISDIENGKSTMQVGRVIDLLHVLGFDVSITSRGETVREM